MSNAIIEHLTRHIEAFHTMGHSAPLERFVLRNGKPYKPQPYTKKRGRAKECFSNSTNLMLDSIRGKRGVPKSLSYVEGFAYRPGLFPMLHAWNSNQVGFAIDSTWERPEGCEYFGVEIPYDILRREILRNEVYNEVYGVLDYGLINIKLMIELDPGMKDELLSAGYNGKF